jgi:PAS domain S-box-containing protein
MKVAVPKPGARHAARLSIPVWTQCVISGIRGQVSWYSLIFVLILLPECAAAQAPTKRVLILTGSDPNHVGFSIATTKGIPQETAPTVMTFDWRELQRWGISERSLPPGCLNLTTLPSFWELYKWYIIGLVVACVGEALLIAWLLINRSRRRWAEEAKDKLAAIVESSDDAILSETLDGIITSWNAGAERMYGYSASEIVGQHVSTLAPSDLKKEVAGILQQIRRGESVDHLETNRITKDGRRIDVLLTISPIRDEHRMIVGASTIAVPVVVITGHDSDETRSLALATFPVAYLRKPVNDQVLLDAIALALSHNLQR